MKITNTLVRKAGIFASGGALIALAAPLVALAFTFVIVVDHATFSGNTLTISGHASIDHYPGQASDQHVDFDWGDGTVDTVLASSLASYTDNGHDINIPNWSKSHTYTTGGTHTVTVKIYHSQQGGNESSGTGTFTIQTENTLAACTDGTDNDKDGLIDGNDPDCLGTLQVIKSVVGTTTSPSAFSFKVNNGTSVQFNANGTNNIVKAAGTYSVVENAAANFTATYGNCSNVTVNPGATTTCTVTNTYQAPSFTITASSGANGSISPSGAVSVTQGNNQSFTLTPNAGYHVATLTVDGNPAATSSPYTFPNVQANHTIAVTYAINTYNIVASSGANGSVTPAGTTVVNSGGSQAYAITANAFFHVVDVLVDGISQGAITAYNGFVNVTANHTISATFAQTTHTITVTAGTGGTITPGTSTVNDGSTPSYTITPDATHHITDVSVDGVSQGTPTSYQFPPVTANHLITATFAVNPENTLALCTDTIDNDGDGLTDLADPDCAAFMPVLEVKKVLVGAPEGTLASQFSFKVHQGANVGSSINFEADGTNDMGVSPENDWSVVEDAAAHYTTTYDNCENMALVAGATTTCTITNTYVPPVANLSLTKTVDHAAPAPGQQVTYTITVHNSGPDDATSVVVHDVIPAGLTNVTAGGAGTFNVGSGVWTVGNIANGADAVLHIYATVTGTDHSGLVITNTASIFSVVEGDTDSENNSDGVDITVTCAEGYHTNADSICTLDDKHTDLNVSKSADVESVVVGDTIHYTVTVTNNGPDDATGVVVNDTLPASVTWGSDDSLGAYVPGTGVWTVGNLANGASATLHITVTVNEGVSAGSTIENTASAIDEQVDPSEGNNSDKSDVTVGCPEGQSNVEGQCSNNPPVCNDNQELIEGQCVTDACSDIPEFQETVPEGYTQNQDGTCSLIPQGESCTLVSDETTMVGESTAAPLDFIHGNWITAIAGSKWIWGENPVTDTTVDTTETFTKTFPLDVLPSSATIQLAADNTYVLTVNNQVVSDHSGVIDNFSVAGGAPLSFDLTPYLQVGDNTVQIVVTNTATPLDTDYHNNPAGLDYKITINGAACQEPAVDLCDNIGGAQTEVPAGFHQIGNSCVLDHHGSPQSESGSSGGGGGSNGGGQVLGESTSTPEVLGEACGVYMDKYLRFGSLKNDADQTKKLQEFLNKWMNSNLPVTGFFGPMTTAAVKAFQSKYAEMILKPWGITAPTGLVYLTTLYQVNLLECPSLTLSLPDNLIPWSDNPNVQ